MSDGDIALYRSLPKQVKIVEVGPRDGLQSEQETFPLRQRLLW